MQRPVCSCCVSTYNTMNYFWCRYVYILKRASIALRHLGKNLVWCSEGCGASGNASRLCPLAVGWGTDCSEVLRGFP
jgi:hypothetical protein